MGASSSAEVPRPSVFISYAHEDASFARELAKALKAADLEVWVDEGELRVGDSIIQRVAAAIHSVNFLVALVSHASVNSNWCQQELALAISRGIGDGRVAVLPLRLGNVPMPASLGDVYYLTVDKQDTADVVERLIADISRHLDSPPQRKPSRLGTSSEQLPPNHSVAGEADEAAPIRIIGIDTDGVGRPRNDGSRGSALYAIPLRLSRVPSTLWAELFAEVWDHPPRWSSMHRPGIGSVVGDRILLDGTTLEELERYHMDTLQGVLDELNNRVAEVQAKERAVTQQNAAEAAAHDKKVRDAAERLKFD